MAVRPDIFYKFQPNLSKLSRLFNFSWTSLVADVGPPSISSENFKGNIDGPVQVAAATAATDPNV